MNAAVRHMQRGLDLTVHDLAFAASRTSSTTIMCLRICESGSLFALHPLRTALRHSTPNEALIQFQLCTEIGQVGKHDIETYTLDFACLSCVVGAVDWICHSPPSRMSQSLSISRISKSSPCMLGSIDSR